MRLITFSKSYSWVLLIGSVFGLTASAALTIEKMMLLENPNYKLSCSFNEIFACGSIVTTDQASIFGFANSIIGVIAFPILITLGILGLAKIAMPRFIVIGLAVGTTFAHIFVLWLVYQSLYTIGALCPWCMVVWAVTVPINIFTFTQLVTSRIASSLASVLTFGWFSIVFALIIVRFYI